MNSEQQPVKETLFLFGESSVGCFHMRGGGSPGPACLKLCSSARGPGASSDPGSSTEFLRPWHTPAPGSERGAA